MLLPGIRKAVSKLNERFLEARGFAAMLKA
jgi:hypothetical protein